MDAIERAIRNAFEKGDQDDRAFRERVYRSAYAALERAMQGNAQLTPEAIERRRQSFKATIVQIEQEFVPAVAAPEPETEPQPEPIYHAPDIGHDAPENEPDYAPELSASRGVEPDTRDDALLDVAPSAIRDRRAAPRRGEEIGVSVEERDRIDNRAWRKERRRPYAWIFVGVTLLAALVIGGWWVAQIMLVAGDGQVPNPPAQLEEEEFQPEEEDSAAAPPVPGIVNPDADRDWIMLFEPSDPARIQAPAGTTAEVVERDGQDLLRINASVEGAAVAFDIGEGTLQQLAGNTAVFSIDASGEEGEDTQISVSCDFGPLGDCGRRRYIVSYERGEYLFEVELPDGTAAGAGTISINPDVANTGKTLDVYQIRVALQP